MTNLKTPLKLRFFSGLFGFLFRLYHAFFSSLPEVLLVIRLRWQLIYELALRELRDRYAGQVFGLFWSVGHPLILILIYIFIFGFVFTMRLDKTLEMPLDYTSYILSGMIPWLVFQEVLGKASTLVVNNANVVKQVVFPIEVFPIKTVVSSLFTLVILLILGMLYALITNGFLPWTYVLLPALILLQTMSMIGVCFFLSAAGTYFRDLKDFIQIFLSLAFFFMPVLYLPQAVPSAVQAVLYFNPFSYMVWVYQDVLYFGAFNHPWAWLVFGMSSILVFVYGYRFFKKLSVMFGNVL
jgi:lipopolysaccharide transport system permease protein